ncbi:MAG: acyl-[Lachnospiraceae bacterium]|nr:acyl-[acyl-carrier-protein] thioesterase [Lachnospiraceae bacterium]
MYVMEGRVRYSEVNSEQTMTLSSFLKYFQDCCTFETEDLGIGIDFMNERLVTWMLSSWQVEVNRNPKFGEMIRVKTWPYDFGGFYGYRNFVLEDESGEVCVYANSIWVFIDIGIGKPTRILPEILDKHVMEEKYDMIYAQRKVKMPDVMEALPRVPIMKSQIDTNHHVNNEQYIAIAEQYLSDKEKIIQMRAEYKKAAILDSVIYPFVKRKDDTVYVSLKDEIGKSYVDIQFDVEQE